MKLSDIFKFKLFEGGDKANLKIVNENFEIAEKELAATNKEITDKVTEINNKITELNGLLGGKLDVSKIANNLVTTEEGYALDARMGKVLSDEISKSIKKNETIETMPCSWGDLPSWNCNSTPLKMKGYAEDAVYPLASLPTKNGEWVIGAHGGTDMLFLAFYKTGTNEAKLQYRFIGSGNGVKNM